MVTRKACPACAGNEVQVLLQLPYDADPIRQYLINFYSPQGRVDLARVAGETYQLDRCLGCGLTFQRHVPDDALLMEVYEEWIDPDLARRTDFESRDLTYYSRRAREIERIIGLIGRAPQSLRTLDFGMGWAEWAIMAGAYGCDSAGTELSPQRRAHAAARGVRVIDDPTGERFDFINTEQVLEHVTEPLQLLATLRDALTPDGLVKISVPNGWDIDRRLTRGDWAAPTGHPDSLNPVAPLEHLNCFTLAAMDHMAALCGLQRVPVPVAAAILRAPLRTQLEDIAKPAYWAARRLATRGACRPTYALYRAHP